MISFIERDRCPVCSSSETISLCKCRFDDNPIRNIADKYFSNLSNSHEGIYELVVCSFCKLIYQKYILAPYLMKQLYEEGIPDEESFKLDFSLQSVTQTSQYASDIMLLLNYLNRDPSTLKVYEYGFGWGRWIMLAQAFGCKCSGFDLSDNRNNYIRGKGIEIIPLENLTAESYDLINCEQVLEHVENPMILLKQLALALKQNGLISIAVPGCSKLSGFIKDRNLDKLFSDKRTSSLVWPLEHINSFPKSSLVYLAESLGLRRVKPPLLKQLGCKTYYFGRRRILKNLLLPVYDHFFDRTMNLWFVKPGDAERPRVT